MNIRLGIGGAAGVLLLALAGSLAWHAMAPPEARPAADMPDDPLPVPPIPPRIATGPDYDHCLAMLVPDPDGAANFAEAWQARGGGDGAAHCLALSRIAQGDPAAGAAMLETLAAGSPAPDLARASLFDQAAQARLMIGDGPHAFADATQALALAPDNPDLLVDGGIAAGDLGHYEQAIGDLSHALVLDPSRVDALTWRAADYRHLNQLDRAQEDVDRALGLDPNNAEALLERGIIRQRRHDLAGARTDWERAARLAPDTPTADLAQQNIALLDAGPDQR
jgi:tetratricopeptide (TPR) repeat protein